jgi:hypothetical protein
MESRKSIVSNSSPDHANTESNELTEVTLTSVSETTHKPRRSHWAAFFSCFCCAHQPTKPVSVKLLKS